MDGAAAVTAGGELAVSAGTFRVHLLVVELFSATAGTAGVGFGLKKAVILVLLLCSLGGAIARFRSESSYAGDVRARW